MSYDAFCERVDAFAKRSGAHAVISHEDGKHIARCSDGVVLTANTVSRIITVMWGSGHVSTVSI